MDAYVNAKSDVDAKLAFGKLRIKEGLFNLLRLANFKVDSNKKMSEVDTTRFEGENAELIDTQLSALQN